MRLVVLMVLGVAGSVSAQQQVPPWDGPLLPVDVGKVILSKECERDQALTWSPALRKVAHGLEPGERVWMIVPDAAVPMILGNVECYVGKECGGAWASLALSPKATRNAITVVPWRFLTDRDPVSAPSKMDTIKGACREPPKMTFKPLECVIWDIGFGDLQLQVQTESKLNDDLGYDLVRTHVRVVTRDFGTGNHAQSAWQMVSDGVDELSPRAVLDGDDSRRILWRKDEGIGSPALITVQLSRVAKDGSQTFGRKFTAGGQPCD
jgi:hypothetical protein